VAKVGQGRPRSKRLQRLPHFCQSAKYEHSRSSHCRTGTWKPKSRSRRFDLFCEGQGSAYPSLPSAFRPFPLPLKRGLGVSPPGKFSKFYEIRAVPEIRGATLHAYIPKTLSRTLKVAG